MSTPPTGSENTEEEGVERTEQLEDRRAMLRNVTPGYDMVTARNQEQLWFPTYDLYKIKPVNILAWNGVRLMSLPFLRSTDS